MATKTIKETALDLLQAHGWKMDNRGVWYSSKTDVKVYLGRGYGIRVGKTKVASISITLDRLASRLKQISEKVLVQDTMIQNPEVPVSMTALNNSVADSLKEKSRITDLRRRCHDVIQTWNEDQCLALLAIDVAGVDLAKLTQSIENQVV